MGTVWKLTEDGNAVDIVITATTTEAERRLIALAPEMAELLQRGVDGFVSRSDVLALLARARGVEPAVVKEGTQ
jgi:hypothetical protein